MRSDLRYRPLHNSVSTMVPTAYYSGLHRRSDRIASIVNLGFMKKKSTKPTIFKAV